MRLLRRAPARSFAAATIAALGISALLVGCGSSGPLRPGVSLVPAPPGGGQMWRWTADCSLDPVGRGGCDRGGPILGFAQLNGDEWNLGGAAKEGSLDMSLAPGGAVTIAGNFARTAPCTDSECLAPSAFTWVRGYPNILYGIDQCRASTSPPPSPRLPLPLRLDAIPPHLIGVTRYSTHTSRVTFDLTYDLWLNPTGTRQPCRSQGTLEIVVLTDYNDRALLPPEMQVGTATIPFAAGQVAPADIRTWSVYASNIGRDGETAAWGGTLWFVPDPEQTVGHGRLSVDLSAVLSEAERVLQDTYGWPEPARHYWLDTASFGVEFGPSGGKPTDSGPSRFSVRISAYCLDPRSTPLNAPCG